MADLAAPVNKKNLNHEASDLETAMNMAISDLSKSSSSQAQKDKARNFLRGLGDRFRRTSGRAEDTATQDRLTRDANTCDSWIR
ncbi:MAG: hypothetical protein JST89_20920 [Cyanobacteria bacterium SZAS-4]|nr:hypothetical protein [Cyanobacteria bacterium SZAS-4]